MLWAMPDLTNRAPEAAKRSEASRRWSVPWLMLVLAVSVPASFAVSMLMPYYANNLDRFPLEQMPWGVDYTQLWPYDTVYALPIGLAGIYAAAAGPIVAVMVLVWFVLYLWFKRRGWI